MSALSAFDTQMNGDGRRLEGGRVAAGNNAVVFEASVFDPETDVGKVVYVRGAGENGGPYRSEITAVDDDGCVARVELPFATSQPSTMVAWGTDNAGPIQAELDEGKTVFLRGGVYLLSRPLVLRDGSRLAGVGSFPKRRTSYVYAGPDRLGQGGSFSVLLYVGDSGPNTAVVRLSKTPVGEDGSAFTGPQSRETTDLVGASVSNVHVDANGLAEYGVYAYRAGNQTPVSDVSVEAAVDANFVFLGLFAAACGGVLRSYEAGNRGFVVGVNIFNWTSGEHRCFNLSAAFHTAFNRGCGGEWAGARGSTLTLTSENNGAEALIASIPPSGGPSTIACEYIEANGAGPTILYAAGSTGMTFGAGYFHPGSANCPPQNITIRGITAAGAEADNAGPDDRAVWLTIDRVIGVGGGNAISIISNTPRYTVTNSSSAITFPAMPPHA